MKRKKRNKLSSNPVKAYKQGYSAGKRWAKHKSHGPHAGFGEAVLKKEGQAIQVLDDSPYQKTLIRDATKWQGLMEGLAAMANAGGH